ncbi:hypothetical protein [Bradyrhizobium sp. sBnM-33]|uniref:hypothetical protein n=1 Tax=Bradyrhizobium sp. sBnM-33 TaxID=2831780 RepID=UPI001BCBBB0A|nr:hypothetical protein [Bradyrhizobium sp. sBnM-33]WOH48866.1 hypothetical protein RX328_32965 [Bradyrhizobium sp. sBnM-33]
MKRHTCQSNTRLDTRGYKDAEHETTIGAVHMQSAAECAPAIRWFQRHSAPTISVFHNLSIFLASAAGRTSLLIQSRARKKDNSGHGAFAYVRARLFDSYLMKKTAEA